MSGNNRTCYSCGKEYYYCFSCPDDPRPNWFFMFCCDDCRVIFDTLTSYNHNDISAKEAYEIIKDKFHGDIKNYSNGIQKLYKQLLKEIETENVDNNKKNIKKEVIKSTVNLNEKSLAPVSIEINETQIKKPVSYNQQNRRNNKKK